MRKIQDKKDELKITPERRNPIAKAERDITYRQGIENTEFLTLS